MGPIGSVQQALDGVESLEEWNVLLVTYDTDHERLRREWHRRIGRSPANFGTICVGSEMETDRQVDPVSATGRDVTATIAHQKDLVELGITISLYLDDWDTGRTLVCFHSLGPLLAHAEPEAAFRFLHVLLNRIADTGSIGRFSIDPTATDERTIRTLTPLFDTVIEVEPEEEPDPVPVDTAFDVLRAPRRRYVLYSLRESTEPTTVSALAERVAYHELDADPDRIEVSLRHSHLPKLEDAGLIAVDGSSVRKKPAIDAIGSYLDLASEDDLED